ncbi:glycosyltransferase family 4 protein [Siccirubricoccus sp. KC 17139]|uniref:Glycosyltransferase family 4 protein n=1 Tax=Siccirubricoccus soli TaxID=2899147 RepID=A0ABT1D367_9PROT|nr:glycosyltransferase family 1 protein [Siccirubricoccus soli]MCO6416366.1 glycosyltransferase family 4 protein [Siccirubricoccus soli]MCP2682500.1 glycosyltransferase family 4 protein [Siccirubricoccus soli]
MGAPKRPRIFLDGYNLALDQGTGVATYARNLSFAMARLGAEVGVLYGTRASPSRDPLIREIAFFDERVGEAPQWLQAIRRGYRLIGSPGGEVASRVPVTGQVIATTFRDRLPHYDEIWNAREVFQQAHAHFRVMQRLLPVRMRGGRRPELMHWTYPIPIAMPGTRNIYTMHDLVPLRLPYTTLDNKRRYFRLNRLLARSAEHIVTVSEASKRDIVSLLGVPEERVTNTYQAVDIPKKFREVPMPAVAAEIEGSFGLAAGRYWLFFGAIEPKKNVGRMIQAYLAANVADPLVIVGKKAWKSEQELRLMFDDHIRTLVLEGGTLRTRRKIILLDYAPFRLLVNLIRGARGVLFPSLYEGFGLPALESMLLGTPVITSNSASMPEVVGDAALQVDPYDISGLVQAIQALDGDAELRARLAEAGPRRAALFSPERYAERLSALYAKLGIDLAPPVPAEAPRLAAE